jgi:hypothetical protein
MSSNEHPDMSGSGCDDDYISGEEMEKRQDDAFVAGAQQMREMLARFVENSPGNPNPDPKVIAQSMRANWVPGWGEDPGKPDDVHNTIYAALP